jgi:Uma2 family endonuclease
MVFRYSRIPSKICNLAAKFALMGIPKTYHEKISYADYLTWNDGKRWELIDGTAFDMTPAPGTRHQQVSGALFANIYTFLKGKPCQVFSAPFDVCLFEHSEGNEDITDVIQPDITIICDKRKINEKGIKGAPDWIIEVLSPSSIKYDFGTKLLLYQKYGVKEYWIVDPDAKTINLYKIDDTGKYGHYKTFGEKDLVSPTLFPELKINLTEIFHF